MSHLSPLVWLCALSAAALNSFAALDPTGVYQSYLAALDASEPALTALFSAAQDGVYPWSEPIEPEAPPLFVPDDTPDLSTEPEEPEEPLSPFVSVDASYFDDALFLGDSHTDGFHDYAGLPNATYYTKNGLTVWSALEKSFIELDGEKYTLSEALSRQQFGKIYVMLGINELGSGTTETWSAQYKTVLDTLRALQPDALIFIQAIFHTTQEKSDTTFFKNSTIDERNAAIAQFADDRSIFFIDSNVVFDDETGALRADYSGDGVHVRAPYYVEWRDHLMACGVVR